MAESNFRESFKTLYEASLSASAWKYVVDAGFPCNPDTAADHGPYSMDPEVNEEKRTRASHILRAVRRMDLFSELGAPKKSAGVGKDYFTARDPRYIEVEPTGENRKKWDVSSGSSGIFAAMNALRLAGELPSDVQELASWYNYTPQSTHLGLDAVEGPTTEYPRPSHIEVVTPFRARGIEALEIDRTEGDYPGYVYTTLVAHSDEDYKPLTDRS